MKFVSFVLLSCALMVIGTPIQASEMLPADSARWVITVKPMDTKVIELSVINLQKKTTNITIQNMEGTTTYFSDVRKNRNSYHKKINLKGLADGKYLLVISQGEEKKQQVIVMKEGVGMLLSDVK